MAETIWVFNGAGARFPGGVFTTQEQAHAWIERNHLSGVLTEYPLNVGAYDWAVSNGDFTPKKPEHSSPQFIGGFTSGSQNHFHYENGARA
jgi:hypothetical protein